MESKNPMGAVVGDIQANEKVWRAEGAGKQAIDQPGIWIPALAGITDAFGLPLIMNILSAVGWAEIRSPTWPPVCWASCVSPTYVSCQNNHNSGAGLINNLLPYRHSGRSEAEIRNKVPENLKPYRNWIPASALASCVALTPASIQSFADEMGIYS